MSVQLSNHGVDFRQLFRSVRATPGMYGLDSRYRTAVAFVSGCDMATNRQLLAGFNEWMFASTGGSGDSSLSWSGWVVLKRFPDLMQVRYDTLTPEQQSQLVGDLFDEIDKFLAEAGSTYTVKRDT